MVSIKNKFFFLENNKFIVYTLIITKLVLKHMDQKPKKK